MGWEIEVLLTNGKQISSTSSGEGNIEKTLFLMTLIMLFAQCDDYPVSNLKLRPSVALRN